ncbi:helix-turn-helix domain-containing protein [Microvirga puerhi]|uniref:helix-turn-helix domain-containing protein n=1 Tax=Microvirga puerhi TaxID=2876078 RepID=UPI0034E29308
MGKRHPNHRLVKQHRTYTVEELARLFRVHKNTIRAWQKEGLKPIDDARPLLFKGDGVASFLLARRETAKQPCGPGQIYCLPCRAPKVPDGDFVEYVPGTSTNGNLRGLCPTCGTTIHRRVNRSKIATAAGELEVLLSEGEPRIGETSNLPVNCDLQRGRAA